MFLIFPAIPNYYVSIAIFTLLIVYLLYFEKSQKIKPSTAYLQSKRNRRINLQQANQHRQRNIKEKKSIYKIQKNMNHQFASYTVSYLCK